jgi:hypothetical protein
VKVEHRDGTKTRYRFEFTDRNGIISEIETRTGLTEEEIREVIKFETEDEIGDSDDDNDDEEDNS